MEGGLYLMDVIIDGLTDKWPSKRYTKKKILQLIKMMGMRPVGTFSWRNTDIGPSIWQMLLESHICFDYMCPTKVPRKLTRKFPFYCRDKSKMKDTVVWFHVSSCKPYDTNLVSLYLMQVFNIKKFLNNTPTVIMRGGINMEALAEDKKKAIHKGLAKKAPQSRFSGGVRLYTTEQSCQGLALYTS